MSDRHKPSMRIDMFCYFHCIDMFCYFHCFVVISLISYHKLYKLICFIIFIVFSFFHYFVGSHFSPSGSRPVPSGPRPTRRNGSATIWIGPWGRRPNHSQTTRKSHANHSHDTRKPLTRPLAKKSETTHTIFDDHSHNHSHYIWVAGDRVA